MDFEQIKIAVADIRPGDTLFFHTDMLLNKDQRASMQKWVEDKFPEAEKVVILEGGMRLSVARAGSDQLLEEIRDALVRMSAQLNEVKEGGNSLLTSAV